MPKIYLCFLWHMHQPFYKDLLSGEYKLPWTRLHALKDYYGMVKILEDFPEIRQTFNLVPSMMVQVEEYASGEARDPFLDCALKPAETLTDEERQFLLRHSFHAAGRMIYRYPRFAELFEAFQAQKHTTDPRGIFGVQEFRDLQVISQLAWFDEDFQSGDTEVRRLIEKGRAYSLEDQELMGRNQRELLGLVIPAYKKLASTGQVEISTTPYYHPILPLLCDSNIASVSNPHKPLPRRFQYPEDARRQLIMAREYTKRVFGVAPVGLWPSEGSVSDQVFEIASNLGFEWSATDNGVLARTLGYNAGVEETYKPYVWKQDAARMQVIFRDHLLSDLIGFVYSGMDSGEAAHDFLRRIRANCHGMLNSGRDAMVPIILDGENAWEYYDHNGRPFFRELYRLITEDAHMQAITVREAFEKMPAAPLDHIFPASWISANFDVWIGAEEDNKAWEFLLEARQAYDAVTDLPEDRRNLAYEELLIAEGSDWCWWYGPEHDSANRIEFDQLFRGHLANVYRALGITPPEKLSRPILQVASGESHTEPTGPIRPVVDGRVSSYFEWMGAGIYRLDARSGAMHGKRFIVREMHYGSDGERLCLRIDFHPGVELGALDARFTLRGGARANETRLTIHLGDGKAVLREGPAGAECAYRDILELSVPLTAVDSKVPERVDFCASFWEDGLPLEALPQQGWLHTTTVDAEEWVA